MKSARGVAARAAALAPRKTPRQQRAGQTVAILIEAAAQVLEAEGLEGFNTNAVAARAGISVGSLYQYFPNKDALILALMRREDAAFHDESTQAFELVGGRDALIAYIDAAVRQQLARPRLARLLDIEESRPELQKEKKGGGGLRLMLQRVLRRDDLPPQPNVRIAALDVAAIIRSLTDGAGERGETNMRALRARIDAAVFGYLDRMSASPLVKKRAKTRA